MSDTTKRAPTPPRTRTRTKRATRTSASSKPAQALHIAGLSVWVEGRPISVNAMYGKRKGGGRYLTPEARAWRDLVWLAFRMQGSNPFTADQLPLQLHCTFYGVRADADNLLKLTVDGIKAALDIDDRHFTPITAAVVRSRKEGVGARIEVWAAGKAPAPAAKGAA